MHQRIRHALGMQRQVNRDEYQFRERIKQQWREYHQDGDDPLQGGIRWTGPALHDNADNDEYGGHFRREQVEDIRPGAIARGERQTTTGTGLFHRQPMAQDVTSATVGTAKNEGSTKERVAA